MIILEIRTEKYKNDGDRFYLFNFSASQRMGLRFHFFIAADILKRRFQFPGDHQEFNSYPPHIIMSILKRHFQFSFILI